MFASSDGSHTGLASIRFMSGGLDVTSSGTVSSFGSGSDVGGSEASKAIDANPATSWIRASGTTCGLQIDFGPNPGDWLAVDDILCVVHSGDVTYGPFSGTFDYSDDLVSWLLINTVTHGNTWLKTIERSVTETAPTDGSARCHRIYILENWGGIFVQVPEIEARIGATDQLPAGHSNDAQIRAIASADNSGTQGADHTWDNNMATLWIPAVGHSTGEWFGWITPDPVSYDSLWLNPGDGGFNREAKHVRYETSHDNSTWTQRQVSSSEIVRADLLQQIY
jgi:hypothetical protein